MNMQSVLANVPVPNDIPLPLPAAEWVLVALLVVSFLLHILFINLMIGGTFLSLWAEIKGLKNNDYDILAQEISKTITVNKSLAVVLGVAPLLTVNVLYTVYFYSANSLTGDLWISVVPLVTIAFILLYWRKYQWHRFVNKKYISIILGAIPAAIFLFVPLIFLTNVNLMQFPEKWIEIKGFTSAMMLSNVFPRYFHFLTASFAITGVFMFGYMRRNKYSVDMIFNNFKKNTLLKKWYKLAFFATLLQLIFGPLLFFTLPWKGVNWTLAYIVIAGIIFAFTAMYLLWRDLKSDSLKLGKHFMKVVVALTVTVIFMGTARQTYRTVVLTSHQKAMAAKTLKYQKTMQDELKAIEAATNIKFVQFRVKKELSRFVRRDLYKLFEKDKSIKSVSFDLKRQIINIKYFGDKTDLNEIKNKIKGKEFELVDEIVGK